MAGGFAKLIYSNPESGFHFFVSSSPLKAFFICSELCIGLLLICRALPFTASCLGMALHAFFAFANFRLYLLGVHDCGCLGAIVSTSPVAMLFWDVAVFVAFAVNLPQVYAQRSYERADFKLVCIPFLFTGSSLGFLFTFGDSTVSRFRAYMLGQDLYVESSTINLGRLIPNSTARFSVKLVNRTSKDVVIYGGSDSCRTHAVDRLPMVCPAFSAVSVEMGQKIGGTGGLMSASYRFYIGADFVDIISV